MNLKKLSDPFPASDVEWRVQSSGVKGDQVWARVLAYITNRAIMERLDEVCGPENWRNEYKHGPDGAVLCGLSIRCLAPEEGNDGWVTKWDGAENTDIEAVKGGLSNAMKRAGVQWGIGRYLYQLEEGFANCAGGPHFGKTKDGTTFRWTPPALPLWALPGGAGKPDGSEAPSHPSSRNVTKAAAPAAPRPAATPAKASEPVACPKCSGAMWDNRETKKNPKQPDYKCKDKACDGVIWPPRDGKPAAPAWREHNEEEYPEALRPVPDDLPFD